MRDDLAGKRGERLVVPEHAALDLDAVDELLDEHLLVVLESELDRCGQLFLRGDLRDPDRRAEAGGLDEDRVAEGVVGRLASSKRDVARDRDSAVAHHGLEDVLVHRERGAEHAAPT